MNPILSWRFPCIALAVSALSACAIRPPSPSLYDLGPLHIASVASTALPALAVADIQAPAWLDGQHMYYRLNYVNELQPRAYAGTRWTMAPAALVTQRLKAKLSQRGGVVVSPADGSGLPLLRIDLDDFTQAFPDQQHSEVHVAMRASLFRGRALLSQKNFVQQIPASSADAAGGAAALAAATDAVIDDLIAWLAQQPAAK